MHQTNHFALSLVNGLVKVGTAWQNTVYTQCILIQNGHTNAAIEIEPSTLVAKTADFLGTQ